MKLIIQILFLLLHFKSQSQIKKSEQFIFENEKIDYLFYSKKINSNDFYILIFNESDEKEKIILEIQKCITVNKKLNKLYLLIIPEKFYYKKEKFILEFLSDVLSKRKLIDKNMILITENDFEDYYNDFKIKNKRYNKCFLNKIKKYTLIKEKSTICNLLK